MARGELPLRLPLLRWQLKRAALPLLPEEHRLDAKRSVYRKKKKKNIVTVCGTVLTAPRAQSRVVAVGVGVVGFRPEGLRN